jgi:beta-glucosidase
MIQGQSVQLKIEYEVAPDKNFKAVRYGILGPQPVDGIKDAADLARDADAVLLMVGTNDDWETEGNDRLSLALPGDQDELISKVLEANPNTIVVNNSGSPISMPWLADAPAVIQTWFAGQEFGCALADILLGEVNPSGKLPITFPASLEDTPAFTNYPGEFGKVHYGEGLYVGYRWYSSRSIQPLFCFGHGLSYTSFEYSAGSIVEQNVDGSVTIEFDLQNSGERLGKETVQVYLQALQSVVAKPKLQLACFTKVSLQPGEKRRLRLVLEAESFAHWDVEKGNWQREAAAYLIHVAASSNDLKLEVELNYHSGTVD